MAGRANLGATTKPPLRWSICSPGPHQSSAPLRMPGRLQGGTASTSTRSRPKLSPGSWATLPDANPG